MRKFRSPLLAPMAQVDTQGRGKRIARRRRLVAFIAAMILLVILLVAFQLLPKEGVGYWLYWLHDDIYLPVKGYSYMLFYPTSLVWWGVIAIVLLLWLLFFVRDQSLVRDPHIYLLRRAVRLPFLHSILLTTAGWVKRRGLEPRMLESVVVYERTLALNRLAAQPAPAECAMVADLTQLLINLLILPPCPLPTHLRAALYWQQTFLLMQSHEHEQGTSQLINSIGDVIRPHLNYRERNQLAEALEAPASFEPLSLMVDLLYLAYFTSPRKAEQALGKEAAARLDEERYTWRGKLANSVQGRHGLLDGVRSQLELRLPLRTNPSVADLSQIKQAMPTQNSYLSVCGQLSVGIALNLALLADVPELALAYLDSIEALAFVLEVVGSDGMAPELASALSALLRDLPRPEDYRLSAKLAEANLEKRKEEWKQSLSSKDCPIKAADFALASTQVASLYHAAGPNPDSEADRNRAL